MQRTIAMRRGSFFAGEGGDRLPIITLTSTLLDATTLVGSVAAVILIPYDL